MDIYDIFPRGLNFGEALNLLEPVVVYVFSMAAYALFVFRFYRFVATRDISSWTCPGTWRRYSPSVSWVILTFLSDNRTFPDILLMAIFIIDASFFSVVASLDVLKDIRDHSERILYYLLFLIALEFAVRLIMGFAKFILVGSKEPAPEEPKPAAEPEPLVEGAKPQGDAEATGGTLSGRAASSCPCRRAYGGGLGASGEKCCGDIRSSPYRVRGRLWARCVLRRHYRRRVAQASLDTHFARLDLTATLPLRSKGFPSEFPGTG